MLDRQYRFLRTWRQFHRGDLVPDTFDPGTIATMAARQIIGCQVRTPECPVPDDKMIRPGQTRKKEVAK